MMKEIVEMYDPPIKIPRNWSASKGIEGGFSTMPQLYDLSTDKGEQFNLAGEYPELVNALQTQLDRLVSDTYRRH